MNLGAPVFLLLLSPAVLVIAIDLGIIQCVRLANTIDLFIAFRVSIPTTFTPPLTVALGNGPWNRLGSTKPWTASMAMTPIEWSCHLA